MRICDECEDKHYALGKCKKHYSEIPHIQKKARKSALGRYYRTKTPETMVQRRKYGHEHYWENQKEIKFIAGLNQFKLRLELLKMLGNKCVKCDNSNLWHLQIDHINDDGHIERKNDKKHSLNYKKYLNGKRNIKDIQILCANCNYEKRLMTTNFKYYVLV